MATNDKNKNSSEKEDDKLKNKSSGTEKKEEKEVSAQASGEAASTSKSGDKKSQTKQPSGESRESPSGSSQEASQNKEERGGEKTGTTWSTATERPGPYSYGSEQNQGNQSQNFSQPGNADWQRQGQQFGPSGQQSPDYSQYGGAGGGYPQGQNQWGNPNMGQLGQPGQQGQNPYARYGNMQQDWRHQARGQDYGNQPQNQGYHGTYGRYVQGQENQGGSNRGTNWQRQGQTSDQNWWQSGTSQQQQTYGNTQYPYGGNYGERPREIMDMEHQKRHPSTQLPPGRSGQPDTTQHRQPGANGNAKPAARPGQPEPGGEPWPATGVGRRNLSGWGAAKPTKPYPWLGT